MKESKQERMGDDRRRKGQIGTGGDQRERERGKGRENGVRWEGRAGALVMGGENQELCS